SALAQSAEPERGGPAWSRRWRGASAGSPWLRRLHSAGDLARSQGWSYLGLRREHLRIPRLPGADRRLWRDPPCRAMADRRRHDHTGLRRWRALRRRLQSRLRPRPSHRPAALVERSAERGWEYRRDPLGEPNCDRWPRLLL